MKMRLLNSVAILSLVVGGLAAWGVAQQPRLSEADRNELSVLMRAKLSSSQKVVEGLMAGDFEMIRKGAQDLQRICDATGWRSHDDPIYGMYRTELKRSAGKMIEQATVRNLDGAAYGYMHTVTTCINCHDHCRTVLRVAEVRPQVIPIPVTEAENLARQPLRLYR